MLFAIVAVTLQISPAVGLLPDYFILSYQINERSPKASLFLSAV